MASERRDELYEIVPTEAYSDISLRSSQIQKEIDEIKDAMKSAVGLAKVESNASGMISKMLEMVQTSQRLVEQVSNSNQQLALKVQEALDKMNRTNVVLSEKLSLILDSFTQASESMGGETDESGKALQNLSHSIDLLVGQNAKILEALESIDKNLKRGAVRPTLMPPRAPVSLPALRKPIRPAAALPPQAEEGEMSYEDELPPPPFPP